MGWGDRGLEKEKNYHPSALYELKKQKVMTFITVNKLMERFF